MIMISMKNLVLICNVYTFESRLQIVLDIRGEHGSHQHCAASKQHQVQQPDTEVGVNSENNISDSIFFWSYERCV